MHELRFRMRRGFKFRDHDDDDYKGIPGGDDLDPLLRPDDNNHVRFIRAVVARDNNNNNINNNVQQQQQANAPAMLPRQRREHHAHHPVRAGVSFREPLENNRTLCSSSTSLTKTCPVRPVFRGPTSVAAAPL